MASGAIPSRMNETTSSPTTRTATKKRRKGSVKMMMMMKNVATSSPDFSDRTAGVRLCGFVFIRWM